jgi:hypothetical protein
MKTLLRALGVAVVLAGAAAAQAHDYEYPPQMPPPGAELISPVAPPPLRYEPVPPPPRRGEIVIWQPGHWQWEARRHDWAWIPGAYVERPYRNAAWEPGHWIARHHEWVWIPGHWR